MTVPATETIRRTFELIATDQVADTDLNDLIIAVQRARLRQRDKVLAAKAERTRKKFHDNREDIQRCQDLRAQGFTIQKIIETTGFSYSKVARNVSGIMKGHRP